MSASFNLSGVRSQSAGYNIDSVIRRELESLYDRVRSEFELVTRQFNEVFGSVITLEVGAGVTTFLERLRYSVTYNNPQISELRRFLAGEAKGDKLVAVDYVIPTSIARDSLAVLAGASYNPITFEPERDTNGNYIVEGIAFAGLLFLGKKATDLLIEDYIDLYGVAPTIEHTWHHNTRPERALLEHKKLDGIKFSPGEAHIKLANTTVPWLGPVFYPSDHEGCKCLMTTKLV